MRPYLSLTIILTLMAILTYILSIGYTLVNLLNTDVSNLVKDVISYGEEGFKEVKGLVSSNHTKSIKIRIEKELSNVSSKFITILKNLTKKLEVEVRRLSNYTYLNLSIEYSSFK